MIDFYTVTSPSPNSHKVAIALEEMQLAYQTHILDLSKREQKRPEFLAINPNGKVPVVVDHDNEDFVVVESSAILIYLAEKTGLLLSREPKLRSQVIQWVIYQTANIGPTQGHLAVFNYFAPEKIPFAINHFHDELLTYYQRMDNHLANHEFLVDEYSIADIASFPWIRRCARAEIHIEELPNLRRWLNAIDQRPAVRRAIYQESTT